jgi:hypothetical protein
LTNTPHWVQITAWSSMRRPHFLQYAIINSFRIGVLYFSRGQRAVCVEMNII